MNPDRVIVLLIDHRHGTDVSLHRTQKGAHKALVEYVRDEWKNEQLEESMPKDEEEMIEQYFQIMREQRDAGESYDIRKLEVEE